MPGLRIKLDLTDFIHNVYSKRVMYLDLETVRTVADLENKIRDEHAECGQHQILMFLQGGFLLTTWESIQVLNNEDLIKVVLQPLQTSGESSAQKSGKKRKRAKTPNSDNGASNILPNSNKKAKILPKIFGTHKDRLNHSQDRIKKRKGNDSNGDTSTSEARVATTSNEKKKAKAIEIKSNKAQNSKQSARVNSSSSDTSSSEEEIKTKESNKKQESSSSSESSSDDESKKVAVKKKESSSSSESSSESEKEKKGIVNRSTDTNRVSNKKKEESSSESSSSDSSDDGKPLVKANNNDAKNQINKTANKENSPSSDSSSSSEEDSKTLSNTNVEQKLPTNPKEIPSVQINGDPQQKSANNGLQTDGKKKRKRKRKNKNKNKLPPGVSWTDFYNQDCAMDTTKEATDQQHLNSTPITSAFKGTPSSNTRIVFKSTSKQDSSSDSDEESVESNRAQNEASCDFSAEDIRKLYAMSQPASSIITPARGEGNKGAVKSPSNTTSRQSVSKLMAFQPRVLTMKELKRNSVNGIQGIPANKNEVINDAQTDNTKNDVNTSVIENGSEMKQDEDQQIEEQSTTGFRPIDTTKDTYTNNSFIIQNEPDYTKLAPADAATIKVEDVIAFKRIEMSENYTPELSDYKHGKIVHRDDTLLTIQIVSSVKKKKAGRFELNPDEDIEEETVIQINVADLIDAKIIK